MFSQNITLTSVRRQALNEKKIKKTEDRGLRHRSSGFASRLAVSRILFPPDHAGPSPGRRTAEATISLGRALPPVSSDLPADQPVTQVHTGCPAAPRAWGSPHIWSCCRRGLPCRFESHRTAVRSYRTISPLHAPAGLASAQAVSFCCTFRRFGRPEAPKRRWPLAPP